MNMIDTSVKTYSRAVGVLLILTMVGGWFGAGLVQLATTLWLIWKGFSEPVTPGGAE